MTTMKKEYHVSWSIELNAFDPLDASRIAYSLMCDPSSFKPIFKITDDNNEETMIDLNEIDNPT